MGVPYLGVGWPAMKNPHVRTWKNALEWKVRSRDSQRQNAWFWREAVSPVLSRRFSCFFSGGLSVPVWLVVSNSCCFHPENWGRFPIWLIFFKGVETTNWLLLSYDSINSGWWDGPACSRVGVDSMGFQGPSFDLLIKKRKLSIMSLGKL